MKIRYILGAAGSGKLTSCLNEILEKQKQEPNKNLIFIVPEQFSLQAEKLLINQVESGVLLNIQVLSFKRLAYHIFSEIGASKKVVLEEYGQAMILRKILQNISEDLVYFKNTSYYNFGLIEKIIKILQEFFKYNLTLDDLKELLSSDLKDKNENLFFKMKDLALIYKKYLEHIQKDYITSDETLDILANVMQKSKLVDNSEVWIYGFTGFTAQELNVISKLSLKSERINIALSLNNNNIDLKEFYIFDPFYETKNTIKKMEKIITQNNLILEDVFYLSENKRHVNNSELAHLEKNYFSYNPKTYDKKPENIGVYSAGNKYIEIENTAKNIIKLVREKNYKFKEIAIILGDLDYGKTLDLIFNKYEIPYFLDMKRGITTHPLTELICSALDIIIYNWNYDFVFRYLKTGFILGQKDGDFVLQKDHINNLENYVIAYGIKGKKWAEEFWQYGFYEKSYFDQDEINKTKNLVYNSLKTLNFKKNQKYSVKNISTKIIDFLVEINALETLKNMALKDQEFFEKGDFKNTAKQAEHFQVLNNINLILEKLVEILGDEKITLEEYSKILKTGLGKINITLLPTTQDQVIIGDFQRTRLADVKAIFVLSVNEGIVPSFKDDTEFISDSEKGALLEKGIELAPTAKRLLSQDNFYIYSNITKPSEKLFLSYLTSDLNGKSKKPSFVIQRILQLFPKIDIQSLDENKDKFRINEIYTPKSTFEKMLKIKTYKEAKMEENLVFKDILSWFLQNEKYRTKIDFIKESLKNQQPQDYLSKEIIPKVYTNNMFFSSVSKLEKFRECPFSYFLKYNLNIKDRKVYSLGNLEFGVLYHSILEEFAKLVFGGDLDYRYLSNKQIDSLIEASVTNYTKDLDTDIFFASKRHKYFLEKVKRICKFSAYAIIKQFKKGKFYPYGFEMEFNSKSENIDMKNIFNPIKLELFNKYEMFLTGKIDRIDLLNYDEEVYVKILDYKSSDKNFNILEFYYGLQLQLMMYLDAFIEFNKFNFDDKNILPAGAFYFKVNEPIIKVKKNTDATKLMKEMEKSFNIKGIILDENKIINGFEEDLKTFDTKKIDYISSATSVTKAQFSKLRKFVNIISKDIGTQITDGNIKISPYKYKQKTGCEYCEYKAICGIEILENYSDKNGYNILKEIKKDEIWNLIDKKIEDAEKER